MSKNSPKRVQSHESKASVLGAVRPPENMRVIVWTAVVTAVVAALVNWLVARVTPLDPRIEAQLKQIETATEKDSLIIELARRTTGNTDSQTVERVRQELTAFLSAKLTEYPTREEFFRENHRYVDEKKGVIWQTEFRDGNLYSYVVAAYTNNVDKKNSGERRLTEVE